MRTYSDTTYVLGANKPMVTPHDRGTVSLHVPGYYDDHGRGFSVEFAPHHIPVIKELLAAMEAKQGDDGGRINRLDTATDIDNA